MNARESILADVRRALAGAPQPGPVPHRVPRSGAESAEEVVARFVERVADYRAQVVRCAPGEVEAAIQASLPAGSLVVIPPGLPWVVSGAVQDEGFTARELDWFDGVVTTATAGIAETGTIVLTHGAGEGRRALSLVPDLHVCVITEAQVEAGVGDALARLDPAMPQTWISGPSATSDIELQRVEGVHGPRRLYVVVVSGGTDADA
jgi:L-lactate dehydrogenase complex protein LldG